MRPNDKSARLNLLTQSKDNYFTWPNSVFISLTTWNSNLKGCDIYIESALIASFRSLRL